LRNSGFKYFLVLLSFFLITENCFAQDSTMPFKYEGDDKWLTQTEFVRQYDKDLSQLDFYDSAYAELEK
jgi:hypothetical protein